MIRATVNNDKVEEYKENKAFPKTVFFNYCTDTYDKNKKCPMLICEYVSRKWKDRRWNDEKCVNTITPDLLLHFWNNIEARSKDNNYTIRNISKHDIRVENTNYNIVKVSESSRYYQWEYLNTIEL